MRLKPNYKRYLLNALVSIAFVIIASLLSGNIKLTTIIPLALIFCIASLALNMVCGCLGELALGHGGFMLVGGIIASFVSQKIFEIVQNKNGYTLIQMNEVFYNKLENTLYFEGYVLIIGAVIIGAIVTGLIGYLIALALLGRMKGDYLAIITLGIGLVFVSIANNLETIGGIEYGVEGPSLVSKLHGNTIIFASFFVLTLIIFVLLFKSRHGRAILSIREDAIAAEASGIPVKKYKILTFAISAGFAGLAGGLYYHFQAYLGTTTFSQDKSIELLVFIVLGGLGSFSGTIISTVVLTFTSYSLLQNAPSGYQQLIYGVILIIIMLVRPDGLMGTSEITWDGMKSFFKKVYKRLFKKNELTIPNTEEDE